jgi:hypothetical protein
VKYILDGEEIWTGSTPTFGILEMPRVTAFSTSNGDYTFLEEDKIDARVADLRLRRVEAEEAVYRNRATRMAARPPESLRKIEFDYLLNNYVYSVTLQEQLQIDPSVLQDTRKIIFSKIEKILSSETSPATRARAFIEALRQQVNERGPPGDPQLWALAKMAKAYGLVPAFLNLRTERGIELLMRSQKPRPADVAENRFFTFLHQLEMPRNN